MNFLLEVGTEEIPAGYIAGAAKQLWEFLQKGLQECELGFGQVKVFDTPRRLAVSIAGLAKAQEDKLVEKVGPSLEVAYLPDGKSLSKAGEGFLRSSGCDASQICVVDGKKGKSICVKYERKGKSSKEILTSLATEAIEKVSFPKSMKWGSGSFFFARPIRWLVALLDDEVLDVQVAGVKAGRVTYSHREFGGEHILPDVGSYEQALLDGRVIVDRKRRMESILEQFAQLDVDVVDDDKLMSLVCDIVEYPVVMVGEFEQRFLLLPEKIIVTTLCEHQKCFATRQDGKLVNKFVFVSNGKKENEQTIILGNQKVAKARLSDAEFFYKEDTKQSLLDYYPDLGDVTFQRDLGSLLSKVQRVESVCNYLAKKLDLTMSDELCLAAKLCKCDLVTTMLGEKEFTKLQGYIGKEYAVSSGVSQQVAEAIEEHYLPKGLGGELPKGTLGAVLAIADKLDTLCGIVGIGMLPTGSADPFALRRAATGICRIVLDRGYDLELVDAVRECFALQPDSVDKKHAEFVIDYLLQRAKYVFGQKKVEADLLHALLDGSKSLNLLETKEKLAVLQPMKCSAEFLQLVLACKRIDNILAGTQPRGKVLPELLQEKQEKELYDAYSKLELESEKDFAQVIEDLVGFCGFIERFFDKIMVNAEDEKLKMNRCNLLAEISASIKKIVDLSKIEAGELK